MAAQLAYYLFFALFPTLLVLLALASSSPLIRGSTTCLTGPAAMRAWLEKRRKEGDRAA
jgi:hypothetical protein